MHNNLYYKDMTRYEKEISREKESKLYVVTRIEC
jgi:hypothetical protein